MNTRLDFIETFTGRRFKPLDPSESEISIEDIAHALSNQCRFSGHCRSHYSVAEHSIRVSKLLADWGESPSIQLWGLLHDASEAYLVDIPTPLKISAAFAAYRDAERRLQIAICQKFGLPLLMPEAVRRADAVLLATEARDLMPFRPEHWGALTEQPLPERIHPLYLPGDAKWGLLERFADLTHQLACQVRRT